jgi:hypothetical protein
MPRAYIAIPASRLDRRNHPDPISGIASVIAPRSLLPSLRRFFFADMFAHSIYPAPRQSPADLRSNQRMSELRYVMIAVKAMHFGRPSKSLNRTWLLMYSMRALLSSLTNAGGSDDW